MDESVLDAIGSPLVAVPGPEGATVAAKLEWKNPGGSAKDRPALFMVRAAEVAGALGPGDRLVEPTSGNTGVGLALVAAALGYELTVVMPASKSAERRRLIKAYGAEVELVEGDIADARTRADAIEAETGAVQLHQFENEANVRAHYETTGAEIIDQVDGREVDAFVAAVGTGGTLMGAGRRLREAFPDVELVAVEPDGNAALSGGRIGADRFEGMGPGFVSELVDPDVIDRVETVAFEDAVAECRRLARDAGLLVGQSSGAASLAACHTASRLLGRADADCPEVPTPDGGTTGGLDGDGPLVVTVFPDSGERYLSTGLFDA